MFQEKREIRVQVEQGAAQEAVNFQNISVGEIPLVVSTESSKLDSSAIEGIEVAKAVQLTRGHQVQRNLA